MIAGSLLFGFGADDAPVDVCALLVECRQDAARLAVEFECAVVIADVAYDIAGESLQVDVCLAAYFAGDNHLAGCDECLASDF